MQKLHFGAYNSAPVIKLLRHSDNAGNHLSIKEIARHLYDNIGEHEISCAYLSACNAVINDNRIQKFRTVKNNMFNIYFIYLDKSNKTPSNLDESPMIIKGWENEFILYIESGQFANDEINMTEKINDKYTILEILVSNNRFDLINDLSRNHDLGSLSDCINVSIENVSDYKGLSLLYKKTLLIQNEKYKEDVKSLNIEIYKYKKILVSMVGVIASIFAISIINFN